MVKRREIKQLVKAKQMLYKLQKQFKLEDNQLPDVNKIVQSVKNGLKYQQLVKSLDFKAIKAKEEVINEEGKQRAKGCIKNVGGQVNKSRE